MESDQKPKKRILFVGEASSLNTGFSTYYRELLPRLAATGKFEIAELGSYATQNDPQVAAFIRGRWKFYGNNPETEEEKQAFQQQDPAQPGQNTNQFGKWKFEAVLADFRPDIVIDIRDWWMIAFQERSPFRKYFRWLVMPTVDSIPQKEEWIQTYTGANYVMAYSDFGIDSLRKSNPLLEVRMDPPGKKGFILGADTVLNEDDSARKPGKLHPKPLRPGVDLETFKPRNKVELKQKWGIKPDIPIVLLVQRNQARKRISEVLRAFAMMKQLEQFKDDDFVQKSILVLHTGWPDNAMSIDFPRAVARIQTGYHGCPIERKGFIREVQSTFMCQNQACGNVFIAPSINLRQNPVVQCVFCGKQSARTPTTAVGYTREQLAEVYGMADIMVQMSIAEGCGMPVQEAKACGIPVLLTNYAAIAEKGRLPTEYDHIDQDNYSVHKGGEVMDLAILYEEPETTCWRAMTSIEDCAQKMGELLSNRERLDKMSIEARECAEENYDWNKNWKDWDYILSHISVQDRSQTWDKPVELIKIETDLPAADLDDEAFVVWCYTHLLGYKSERDIDEPGRNNWMQKLTIEAQRGILKEKTRGDIVEFFRQQAEGINRIEQLRAGPKALTETTKPDVDNTNFVEAIII